MADICPSVGVVHFPVSWHSVAQQLVLNGKKVKGIPEITSSSLFWCATLMQEKPPKHQGTTQKQGVEKTQEMSGRED